MRLVDPQTGEDFIHFVAGLAARLIKTADARRGQQPFLRLGAADLTRFLKELSFAMRALLFLESAHKDKIKLKHIPDANYPFDKLFGFIFQRLGVTRDAEEQFSPHRDAFMLDVIGNTICADLLDYAKRDAASAGLKLDYDANRIIENFTLITIDGKAILNGETSGKMRLMLTLETHLSSAKKEHELHFLRYSKFGDEESFLVYLALVQK
jgi:hypothetical protein